MILAVLTEDEINDIDKLFRIKRCSIFTFEVFKIRMTQKSMEFRAKPILFLGEKFLYSCT